jgi:UDP-N-acetylmuramate dehydrogenase
VGGAKVSEVHANFIINAGDATAQDVQTLIKEIRECVKAKKNIDLEPEVRFIPWRPLV